jgi:hypothetical protein
MKITVMLSVLANGRELIPFDTLCIKNLPKGKFPSGIVIKHAENRQMTEELMVEWLRQVWHRNYVLF